MGLRPTPTPSFPDAQLRIVDVPLGAGPESIIAAVVMAGHRCSEASKMMPKFRPNWIRTLVLDAVAQG